MFMLTYDMQMGDVVEAIPTTTSNNFFFIVDSFIR